MHHSQNSRKYNIALTTLYHGVEVNNSYLYLYMAVTSLTADYNRSQFVLSRINKMQLVHVIP